jgi:hypothetical protein
MKIDKPSDADKAYFTELFGQHPALEIKPMFGNLAAFVSENQQMCAGLFGSSVGVRLAEDDRDELLAVAGAGPFGPEGRPMKEYITIPYDWRNDGADAVDAWIDRAVAHTESLPAKKKKVRKTSG